jgi:NAD(P)-dependent dehydrogenase (short-subunit alcohol dehydrogenase family)
MDKAVEAIEQAAPNPTATISSIQVFPFIIDMLDTHSISADIQGIFEDKVVNRRLLLINNAGVCLEGCTIEAMKESLKVNCLGPAFLCEMFLNYANNDHKEFGNQISIINVSSGDGELVFLHSEIQRQINAIETYKVHAKVPYIHINFFSADEYTGLCTNASVPYIYIDFFSADIYIQVYAHMHH